MILSSLDLCTRMLCTADVSAATTAKPSPTSPNMHSIVVDVFVCCLCFGSSEDGVGGGERVLSLFSST